MMSAADIAQLFDDLRPAYSLVDFEEVGLPVYRLVTTVLTLEPKKYSPIEEFVIKAIDAGMTTSTDVAGLLGIDTRVVEGCLTNLIRDDDVFASPSGVLTLTKKSRAVLDGEKSIRPREQAVVFHFDALTRRPRYFGLPLRNPKDLRSLGLREIRAFPPRKPEPDEIDIHDLEETLEIAAGTRKKELSILRVREVGRKENQFIPAVMLVYRAKAGAEVRVRFAIDGRLSAEHEKAFLIAGGVEKLGIRESVLSSQPKPALSDIIGAGLAAEVSSKITPAEDAEKIKRRVSIARFKAEIARKSAIKSGLGEKENVGDSPLEKAVVEAQAAELELANLRVRPIAVYEHPPLLQEALEFAKRRILIISPWITPAVVDTNFLRRLQDALIRGVDVRIGYGLDDRRRDARSEPNEAEKSLHELTNRYHNLKVLWLGNTHAKILVKDSDWFVVSSFNWLSFRGDPRRTFREEWGTLVGVSDVVDKYYNMFSDRFL